nr:PREDICTED: protein D3-like isoform X1 [Bemisia tabaci]
MVVKVRPGHVRRDYKCICIFLVLAGFFIDVRTSESKNYIEELLIESKIIPDVLDVAPKHELLIIYADQSIKLGTHVLPSLVHGVPTDVDWPYDAMAYYTLIMTDPDSPSTSNPYNKEWQHWVVGNIPEFRVKLGEVLTPHIGAVHPKGNGLHRYVFTVFKQPEKVNFTDLILDERPSDAYRANFSTRNFAHRYKFGDPHAVNYFVVNWDTP